MMDTSTSSISTSALPIGTRSVAPASMSAFCSLAAPQYLLEPPLRVQGAAQWWRMLLERAQKLSRRLARTAVRLDLDHEEDHLSVGRRIPIMMKNTGQMVGGVKSLENDLSNRCGSLRARAAVALEGRFELE